MKTREEKVNEIKDILLNLSKAGQDSFKFPCDKKVNIFGFNVLPVSVSFDSAYNWDNLISDVWWVTVIDDAQSLHTYSYSLLDSEGIDIVYDAIMEYRQKQDKAMKIANIAYRVHTQIVIMFPDEKRFEVKTDNNGYFTPAGLMEKFDEKEGEWTTYVIFFDPEEIQREVRLDKLGYDVICKIHDILFTPQVEVDEETQAFLDDCQQFLDNLREGEEEYKQQQEDLEFLLNEWRTNKRYFREDPGHVTTEDVIKTVFHFAWQRKSNYDYLKNKNKNNK